jgi:MerR family transcriptional regulator, thiopeptide resistance regulator
MLLKVGELAKRTGLTVRALHHYDHIGLLRPSGHSESGYRLYNREDVARLHAIQTLRAMGLSLADVAQLLDGDAVPLPAIIARQIGSLDQQIAQALALRERLGVMQMILASGRQPEIDDWLVSLALMNTFEQYFSVGELKLVFERWKRGKAEWAPLLKALQELKERGVPPRSVELQPLIRKWLDLSARWMNGDIALLKRWSSMLSEQPDLPLPHGLDRALLAYIEEAIQLRWASMAKYISVEELQRLDNTLDPEWRTLAERVQQLMNADTPPESPQARELAHEWQSLLDRMVRHGEGLRTKLLAAYANEPLLRAGTPFTPEVHRYMWRAAGLDPDAPSGSTLARPR